MEAKNEKVKENHCKFVIQFNSIQFNSIQFNSIQFNSIPKIVFLTALLFILLFSISCKAKQKPEEHSRAELVGTWWNDIGWYWIRVDDNGYVKNSLDMSYSGKVDENFYYPYTITMKNDNNNVVVTITFNSATDCIAHYITDTDNSYYRNYKKGNIYIAPAH